MKQKYNCIVMGAAGRDFHIFLSFLRNNEHFRVRAFTATQIPFIGGAVGYFAYDIARQLENIPCIAKESSSMPDMQFGVYDTALVFDHQLRQSYLVGYGDKKLVEKKLLKAFHEGFRLALKMLYINCRSIFVLPKIQKLFQFP